MDIITNTTLVAIGLLFTLSAWGMVGAAVLVFSGVEIDNDKRALSGAYSWPVVLVFMGAKAIAERINKQ